MAHFEISMSTYISRRKCWQIYYLLNNNIIDFNFAIFEMKFIHDDYVLARVLCVIPQLPTLHIPITQMDIHVREQSTFESV